MLGLPIHVSLYAQLVALVTIDASLTSGSYPNNSGHPLCKTFENTCTTLSTYGNIRNTMQLIYCILHSNTVVVVVAAAVAAAAAIVNR